MTEITPTSTLCYLFGALCVLMYGFNEFEKPTSPSSATDISAQALPRELTSERRFLTAWIFYVFGLLIIYAFLSFVLQSYGTHQQLLFGIIGVNAETIPLLAAFCLIGFMNNFPVLRWLDHSLRTFMHRRAYIPSAVEDVIKDIDKRELSYHDMPSRIIGTVAPWLGRPPSADRLRDFMKDNDVLPSVKNWVLLSCMIELVPVSITDVRRSASLGSSFYRRHLQHFYALRQTYRDLKERITARLPAVMDCSSGAGPDQPSGGSVAAQLSAATSEYERDIDDLLRKVKAFAACLVVSRPNTKSRDEAIREIFFGKIEGPNLESENNAETDATILAVGAAFFAAFVLYAATPYLAPYMPDWLTKFPQKKDSNSNLLETWSQPRLPTFRFWR